MSGKPRKDLPPVGVLASSKNVAESLARELNLHHAIALSPNTVAHRGIALGSLIVDDSAWPLDAPTRRDYRMALSQHQGYILHVTRHDPQIGKI